MNAKDQLVLDDGYVRHVESWGRGDAGEPEAGIIEAARQSTQGCFRGWETDKKLLATLFNSNPQHATPFEFAGMVIEVQAPIFVFREWHRHRTQSYNEMSARYAPLPDLNYLPSLERIMLGANATSNKQAGTVSGSEIITEQNALKFQRRLVANYTEDQAAYLEALNDGVPKELARAHLPVGRYSRMRAQTNLRNWLAFITLRADPAAQWEIRQFALAVCRIVAEEFPQTWSLYHAKRERRESWKAFAERVKITVSKIRSDKEDGVYARLYAADMEQMLLHLQDG
jgi:thymidylate synthase (FAD)